MKKKSEKLVCTCIEDLECLIWGRKDEGLLTRAQLMALWSLKLPPGSETTKQLGLA